MNKVNQIKKISDSIITNVNQPLKNKKQNKQIKLKKRCAWSPCTSFRTT